MNKTYTGLLYGKQDHPQGPKNYFKIEANSKRKFKLWDLIAVTLVSKDNNPIATHKSVLIIYYDKRVFFLW